MNNQLLVFFDGECPLCKREIKFLESIIHVGNAKFLDISEEKFEFDKYNKTYSLLMSEIHALKSDGTWLTGMEVFREVYSLTKFRYLVKLTRLPLIKQIFNICYSIFAKNRLKLTGRQCKINRSSCKA